VNPRLTPLVPKAYQSVADITPREHSIRKIIMSENVPMLLTVRQAVELFGIPRSTMYRRFISTGLLVPRKIGKATRLVAAELAALVANLPKMGD
jgi:hypothetical protein